MSHVKIPHTSQILKFAALFFCLHKNALPVCGCAA